MEVDEERLAAMQETLDSVRMAVIDVISVVEDVIDEVEPLVEHVIGRTKFAGIITKLDNISRRL